MRLSNAALCGALLFALSAPAIAAPLVYVQILARPDGTDQPFSSTISPTAVGEEFDYIVVATLAPAGTVNTNLPVDPNTHLQDIDHYVSGAGTSGTVPTTDGLEGLLYSAYEATNQTTQVSFQLGVNPVPSTGDPTAGYAGIPNLPTTPANETIDPNIFAGVWMKRSTGSGSQVNGNALITGGVNTNLYGYSVSGEQSSPQTLKPTSLTSQTAGYALFNNYGVAGGATAGVIANRGNGYNDLVRAAPIGPAGNGYYGIDANTGISGQSTTSEKPYTVILADGSNLGGEYGSGGGDPNGNDTTFVVKSLVAGTSTLNLAAEDMNPGNPGGALTQTTNFLNIEYHNSEGTLITPGIAGSFQYSAQTGSDPVIAYTGLTIIGTSVGNTSVLTMSPNTGSFGNVLRNGTVTTTATINNTPGNGTDVGTYNGVTSNNGITAPATGSANPGNNTINVSLNANANGSGTNGSNSWTYTIANTSSGNTDTGDNKVLTMSAVIGNAGADTTNSSTTFGPALVSTQVAGSSFDGLASTVVGSSSGAIQGGPLVHSTATLLQGQNNSGGTDNVTMAWRGRTLAETSYEQGGTPTSPPLPSGPHDLVSDVVDLSLNAGGPDDATSVFALEVSYQNLGPNEGLLASKGLIYLAWLNPVGDEGTTPLWVNAVNGNNGHGTTVDTDVLASYSVWAAANSVTDANIGNFLGSWGVDLADDEVWAVLNHNSQFAVVPEPAAIVLAFCGLLSLWGAGKRIPKPVRS